MPQPGAQRRRQAESGKPPRRSHKERIELSDKAMLDAAEALIIERGTHATTLQAVGERAGYSRGLAHARFGSKDQLFMRLAERCLETWYTELWRVADGKRGLDALMSRLDAVIAYALKSPSDAQVLYILWFQSVGVSSPMKQRLSEFHKAARADVAALLAEAAARGELSQGVDINGLAVLITSAFFGLAYQWLVDPDCVDIVEALNKMRLQISALLAAS